MASAFHTCHYSPLTCFPRTCQLSPPPPRPSVSFPSSSFSRTCQSDPRSMSTCGRAASPSSTPDASRALQDGIAEFYDESSGIWEAIWGDHMHHGFYDPDSDVSGSDHRAAQIRMIEESLRFAGISGSFSLNVLYPRVRFLLDSRMLWNLTLFCQIL